MLLTSKARALPPFLAAIAATTFLAACSSSHSGPAPGARAGDRDAPGLYKAGPVVFAVSGRQDSPAPAVTSRMQAALQRAVAENSAVGLVDVDGAPKLVAAGSAHSQG